MNYPILLHTHATNIVARYLVDNRLIPALCEAEVVRSEVVHGHSRFDFLLREGERNVYLEVKSCTLFGNNVAMFPDAVTTRGKRHLENLAEIAGTGSRSVVLFIVHYPHVEWFMPDYHTDLEFSNAFIDVRDQVEIIPAAIGWRSNLSLETGVKILEIPWEFLHREVVDRGSYLLLLELTEGKTVEVGNLGTRCFERGYYLYVGSAMHNLSARLKRHRKRNKKLHWHIDYLREVSNGFLPIAIRSSQKQECAVAKALSEILEEGPAGFGSSDCRCSTHLFRCEENPLHRGAFHEVLQRFRMSIPPSQQALPNLAEPFHNSS
jgi:sugar fermentation stimulation protein A